MGAYRLVRELGRGGMGTVYHAERADEQYRARVAIKFVRGAFAAPELARRFRAERQILADLRHPNIAQLLDGGATSDGTPYLVMEYLDGVSIDVWCDQQDLDVRARVSLFLHVCDAISYAHGARVVHSDIKPSNILVDATGVPKVVDFGIAKLLDPEPGQETTILLRPLTPAYASPEQQDGGAITTATDVFALGAVLYRLLVGRPPAATTGNTIAPSAAAMHRNEAWRDALADGVDDIIMRALQHDPADRQPSAAALAADLRTYLDRPSTAASALLVRHARRYVHAHRGRIAAGILGAAGVAMFSGYFARARLREAPLQFEPVSAGLASPPGAVLAAVADMTGDGRADLVWSHMDGASNSTRIDVADGRGGFAAGAPVSHPASPPEGWHSGYGVFTGDFDGDGTRDLLWNGRGQDMPNRAFVALSQPDGGLRFSSGTTLGPTRWSDAWKTLTGDVNGDGADDLVFNVLDRTSNTMIVSLSNRDGTFGGHFRFSHRAANWNGYRTFIADVDGDGLDDVVWNGALSSGNRIYVARARGAGNFDLLSYSDYAGDWSRFVARMGDTNHDGRADLVWIDTTGTAATRVGLGTRDADFAMRQQSISSRPGGSSDVPILGDFPGPGRARIAWLPAGASGGFAADVNGDGRDDLVWYDAARRIAGVSVAAVR